MDAIWCMQCFARCNICDIINRKRHSNKPTILGISPTQYSTSSYAYPATNSTALSPMAVPCLIYLDLTYTRYYGTRWLPKPKEKLQTALLWTNTVKMKRSNCGVRVLLFIEIACRGNTTEITTGRSTFGTHVTHQHRWLTDTRVTLEVKGEAASVDSDMEIFVQMGEWTDQKDLWFVQMVKI